MEDDMRFQAVATLTFGVVLQSQIILVQGGEALSLELPTARDLYSSTSTMFIDETESTWGAELAQQLFFLLVSTVVPEDMAITLREKRVSKNNMSEILLLINNEPIGTVRINHLKKSEISENVNILYTQFIEFRNNYNRSRVTP